MAHELVLAARGSEQAAAAGEEGSQLPCELWACVLRLLPPRERLLCAALVCKALRAAAAAATDSIQCRGLHQEQCDALSAWLGHSGSAVPVISLELEGAADGGPVVLRLPFAQLAGLRSLSVRHLDIEAAPAGSAEAGTAAAGGDGAAGTSMAACTVLTRLECRVNYPACRLSLAGLPQLRGLRHLDLLGAMPRAGSELNSLISAVGRALLQLTQLTHLALPAHERTGAALQHISALQQLQHLSAGWVADPAVSLGALPSGLTALRLITGLQAPVLSPSSLPGWAQLTGLQRLELEQARVEPALLAACGSRLRHLALQWCQLEGAAADVAALTASSELACLDLSGTHLPPGAAARLWPAGRSLPQLRVLRGDVSLVDSGEAASGLVRCCPALEELVLYGTDQPDWPEAVELAPLRSLAGLTHLDLFKADLSGSWVDVCSLTGLRCLVLENVCGVSFCDLAAASRLTRLTQLSGSRGGIGEEPDGDKPWWGFSLANQAPADEPPDVCPAQLLEALLADYEMYKDSEDEARFRLLEDAAAHMHTQRQQLAASRAEVAALQARVAQLEQQCGGGRQ